MNERKAEDLAVALLQVDTVIDSDLSEDEEAMMRDVASTLKRLLVEECTGMDAV